MSKITTYTHTVSGGSGTIDIPAIGLNNVIKKVSYQAVGDANVDAAVTVKMQESNLVTGTYKDISGSTATVNTSTNEFIGVGDFTGAYLRFDVSVGTATLGIVTLTVSTK
jgi:hypothetical protein